MNKNLSQNTHLAAKYPVATRRFSCANSPAREAHKSDQRGVLGLEPLLYVGFRSKPRGMRCDNKSLAKTGLELAQNFLG